MFRNSKKIKKKFIYNKQYKFNRKFIYKSGYRYNLKYKKLKRFDILKKIYFLFLLIFLFLH